MKIFILLAFLFSISAQAAVYTRQHSDTIVSDKVVLSDDLNDELDAIQTAVNGIDSGNITDGTVLAEDQAATSSALFLSRKQGCHLSRSSTTIIQINPPCEIFHNSLRGIITATAQVNLTDDLDTGAAATGTNYFVYGAPNTSASIDFQISATEPEVLNRTKLGDSTRRYIGSFRSDGSTATNIVDFVQVGNVVEFVSDSAFISLDSKTFTSSDAVYNWNAPNFIRDLLFTYEIDPGSYQSICIVDFTDISQRLSVYANSEADRIQTWPWPVPIIPNTNGPQITAKFTAISTCRNVRIGFRGWVEPMELHE